MVVAVQSWWGYYSQEIVSFLMVKGGQDEDGRGSRAVTKPEAAPPPEGSALFFHIYIYNRKRGVARGSSGRLNFPHSSTKART